jgi:hypothetical protein
MVVMVSLRDYQRIQKLRPSQEEEYLEHPDAMPIEEVERIYAATAKSTEPETLEWRGKAALSIELRNRNKKWSRATDPPS